MKILVLDEDSQVGDAMIRQLRGRTDAHCLAVRERQLVAEPDAVVDLIRTYSPDFIVNAYSIEIAEHNPGLDKAHVKLVKRLCKVGQEVGAGFLHVSSAQVFDGTKDSYYLEDDRPRPATTVGRRLLELERGILKTKARALVLRSGWIFGREGHGLFDAFLHAINQGHDIPINPDMIGAPTPALDVARVLFAMMQQLYFGAEGWGIYHYCCSDVATSRDFAETVVAMASQYSKVEPASIKLVEVKDAYKTAIPRHPLLECNKILNTFGIKQRPWRSAMTSLLRNLYLEAETA